jgi:hypothetical protein
MAIIKIVRDGQLSQMQADGILIQVNTWNEYKYVVSG